MAQSRTLVMAAVHTRNIILAAPLIQMSREAAHIGPKGKYDTCGNGFYALCDLVLICGDEFQFHGFRTNLQLNSFARNGIGVDGIPTPTG